MKYKQFKDINLSRLGMGNMRLPSINPSDPKSPIDYVKAHEIIDYAYDKGVNYFDTAYVYNAGESERCLGECMKKHPRESFYLATKFHIGANPDYKAVFEEQLARLQTNYIDFYLIHCLTDSNIDEYINSGAIEYFLKLKEEGKIKYLGFSSHASVETLRRFANHHKWDFAQLQINYYDWNFSFTKEEYKILEERDIPCMVMEPVRGGRLANLTDACNAKLNACAPNYSIASWALRFVETLANTQVILSGMSDMNQVIDNVNTFSDEHELDEKELALLDEVVHEYKNQIQVPCTSCRYCTDTCPSEINIPAYLNLFNAYKVDGNWALFGYDKIDSKGKPSDCISCGACTGHCPQNIDTPSIMVELANVVDKFKNKK